MSEAVSRLPARRPRARLTVEVRRSVPPLLRAGALMGAVALGLALSALALIAAGVPPGDLVGEFLVATLFDPVNLKSVFVLAAPLALVGLAAALAFRVRFWNLGLEGQMIFGGVGATAVSLGALGPEPLRLWLMMAAAMAGGALWAAIPGGLKLRIGVNEIISTLLLNYVAYNFLLHLLYGAWKDPDNFPHSNKYAPCEILPDLALGVNAALAIAAFVALALTYLISRHRAGVYMRFIGANPGVAQALGAPVQPVIFATIVLSGAIAGLAGFVVSSAQEGRLTQSFFQGYGVSGVLIGFLARSNPLAAALVGVLMAALTAAGQNLQVFYSVPQAMAQLIQALIVMCVAGSDFLVLHRLRWSR